VGFEIKLAKELAQGDVNKTGGTCGEVVAQLWIEKARESLAK
jgi:hypothetical protein